MAYHAIALPSPLGGPMGRLWRAYEGALQRRPLLTQAATSAVLWGTGDALGQRLTYAVCGGAHGSAGGLGRSKSLRQRRSSLDVRQSALTAAFGGAVVGPIGSFWYSWLDTAVASLVGCCANSQVLGKVAADALLYTPIYVSAFFAYGCAVVDGTDPREIRERMVRELPSTMVASTFLWPPAMALVFKRVPVQHQLLIVNLLTVFEVAILSLLRTPTAREFVERTAAVVSDAGQRLLFKAKAGALPLLPGRRRRTLPSKPLTGRLSLLEPMHPPPVQVLGAGALDAPSGAASLFGDSTLFSPAFFVALEAGNGGHTLGPAGHPTVSIPCPITALSSSPSSSDFGSGSDSEPSSPRGEMAGASRGRWRMRGTRFHAPRI